MRKFEILGLGMALTVSAPANAAVEPILIFGGGNHDEFLGCINCSETDPKSVWNAASKYGWSNSFGVWNEFGANGGQFGSHSACNQFTTSPPILIDRKGNSYGYLTVNEFKSGSVCGTLGVEQICRALKVMCAHAD